MDKLIINCETDEQIQEPMTEEEINELLQPIEQLPQAPTVEERIAAIEEVLLLII